MHKHRHRQPHLSILSLSWISFSFLTWSSFSFFSRCRTSFSIRSRSSSSSSVPFSRGNVAGADVARLNRTPLHLLRRFTACFNRMYESWLIHMCDMNHVTLTATHCNTHCNTLQHSLQHTGSFICVTWITSQGISIPPPPAHTLFLSRSRSLFLSVSLCLSVSLSLPPFFFLIRHCICSAELLPVSNESFQYYVDYVYMHICAQVRIYVYVWICLYVYIHR